MLYCLYRSIPTPMYRHELCVSAMRVKRMKKIVLVVDDDAPIREMVCDLLALHGYAAIEAANGQDALTKLTEFSPVLILLDFMMPEMDGLTFAQKLQEQGSTYRLVAFSASGTARTFAEQIGAIGYLEKPFHITQLLTALPTWIQS